MTAPAPAQPELAEVIAATVERVESHPVRNAQTRAVTGYMVPAEEWRSIRAELQRIPAMIATRLGAGPLGRLADEWQRELDSGAIRDPDARYCWSLALSELSAALAAAARQIGGDQ